MKKYQLLNLAIGAAISMMVVSACQKIKDNKNKKEVNISAHGGDESHNMGQNCMSCHSKGGDGEGWFNAAGTVYDSTQSQTVPNTTIRLYSGPKGSGTLVHTVYGDQLGNFHTTEGIDFGSGLYPVVEGPNGTKYMSSTISSGECNSCHGVSTNKIWVKK